MDVFGKYLLARNAEMQRGQNMLAMEQFAQNQQRQRKMQNVLSNAYRPELPEQPAMGPTQPGEALPDYPAQKASFDRRGASDQLLASGFIPEAMAIQPKEVSSKWKVTEMGLGDDLRQKVAYNEADPTQTRPIGKPYKAKSGVEVNVGDSKGFNKVDTLFAKEYVDFKAAGGFADVEKGLSQLNDSLAALKSEDVTGPYTGAVPDVVKRFTNPRALEVKENVEEVVQRNLRLILGAQFTEKEGERLIARAYNENLPEEVNIQRVERLMKQIQNAAIAKQQAIEYYEANNGSLKGFTGKLYNKSDFENLFKDVPRGGKQNQQVAPQAAINYLKNNNSPAMRKQFQDKYGYLPD